MHRATSKRRNLECAILLLEYGAQLRSQDSRGNVPAEVVLKHKFENDQHRFPIFKMVQHLDLRCGFAPSTSSAGGPN